MDQVLDYNVDRGLKRFSLPGMMRFLPTLNQAIVPLPRALQRYPARDLQVEKHGDRDAMTCYHRIGTPQCKDDIAFLAFTKLIW